MKKAGVKDYVTFAKECVKEIPDLPLSLEVFADDFEGMEEEARIICIADCYDAMTSKRSYSVPKSQADVRAEIERCSGSQFDPRFAEIMLAMIDEDTDYRMRED